MGFLLHILSKPTKRVFGLLSTLAFLIITSNCSTRGTILYSTNTMKVMKDYDVATNAFVEPTAAKRQYILHRGGSYQEYAKNINDSSFNYGDDGDRTKDVSTLMDWSFRTLGADGIEIDVQIVPESKRYKSVYVVHDKIKDELLLPDPAKRYLDNNSLNQVIDHYIHEGFFDSETYGPHGKYIYIELKVPKNFFQLNHSPLNDNERAYIQKTVSSLNQAIESRIELRDKQPAIRKHIAFVSFNLFALKETHNLIGGKGHRFFFIAGSNRGMLGQLASLFGSKAINYLNPKMIERLEKSGWLTGIWFDPFGIRRIAKTFNGINRNRKKHLRLEYHISTYKLNRKKYLRSLQKGINEGKAGEVEKLKNVTGLIFDIMRFKDK